MAGNGLQIFLSSLLAFVFVSSFVWIRGKQCQKELRLKFPLLILVIIRPVVAMNKPGFRNLPAAMFIWSTYPPCTEESNRDQPSSFPRSTVGTEQIESSNRTKRARCGTPSVRFRNFHSLPRSRLDSRRDPPWLMEWQLNSRKNDDKSWDLGGSKCWSDRIWLACLIGFGQGASLMFQVIACVLVKISSNKSRN